MKLIKRLLHYKAASVNVSEPLETVVPDELIKHYPEPSERLQGLLRIAPGTGKMLWICGNVICMIEQNNYTNIRSTSGSIEEIHKLNQEAKQQPAYKKGEAMEIGGFAGMLAGAGVAWLGRHKMNKLKNASGQTVATIEYAPTPVGLALALNF